MTYTKAQITEKTAEEFTAIASSEAEDRQGEVVEVKGWNLKNFKDNPILLWMHDHTKPLGKATRIWIDKATNQLRFKGVVSDATEYGRAAKQLMEEGILNSFSVGFRAIDMDGNRITKAELFEISLVTVPANPQARLVAAKSLQDAGFEDAIIKQFTEEEEDEITQLKRELSEVRELAQGAIKQAEVAVKGLQYLAPHRSKQEVVTKRLALSKVIVKAAEKMAQPSTPKAKTVSYAKVIKMSSEKLINDMKGDL